jgi:hypothetical protein
VADLHQAASGADALLLLTEWQQFAQIDWPALAAVMRQPAWLFDARAKADGAAARAADLNVWSAGKSAFLAPTKMQAQTQQQPNTRQEQSLLQPIPPNAK